MEEKIFKIYFPVSFSTTNDVLYELFCCFDMHIAGSHFIDLVLFLIFDKYDHVSKSSRHLLGSRLLRINKSTSLNKHSTKGHFG